MTSAGLHSSTTDVPVISIVSGDEHLLMMEACDQLLAQAKASGMEERQIIDVTDKFNWDETLAGSDSLSLFSQVKLTDIRFSKMLDKKAQAALLILAQSADQENQLLIRLPKLEKRQKNAKWFKTLTMKANVQELWPPRAHELMRWLQQRCSQMGLSLERDSLELLAERTEGNLLAARQSLEKIQLLYPQQSITREMVEATTADNARYSIFMCLDEALAGNPKRAVRMLEKLQQEGVAPIALLVNLTREINLCNQIALARAKGLPPMQALSDSFLWDSKKRLLVEAAARLPLPVWQKLVARCAHLDRMVKGQEKGAIWQELSLCLWTIGGQKIWSKAV